MRWWIATLFLLVTVVGTPSHGQDATDDADTAADVEDAPLVAEGCESRFCVTKCCPYGESFSTDKICKPNSRRFFPCFTVFEGEENDVTDEDGLVHCNGTVGTGSLSNSNHLEDFNLMISDTCRDNRFLLEPHKDESDEFYLLPNGTLYIPQLYIQSLNYNEYCMETFLVDGVETVLPLVCFPPNTNIAVIGDSLHFILYPIGLLISVPFLLITFLVYNLIPKLRDLHGKSLSCYVLSLAVAYVCLATVQLGGHNFEQNFCVGIALAVQCSFIACFFWLNVLCFNTWRCVTFYGTPRYTMEKPRERKYFLCYSIYAWGCTLVFVVVTMVSSFTPTMPVGFLKPDIGENSCWFDDDTSGLPYFYGPVSVLIFVNVVLFIASSVKLVHQHHPIGAPARHSPKKTFRQCVTLFFLMGITWVMELVSYAVGGDSSYWYITDILNTLQGIFVFVIFVMQTKVKQLVRSDLFPKLAPFLPKCCCENLLPKPKSRNGDGFMYPIEEMDEEEERL